MKTSKYPQEAFEVMKYIQNPENQVQSFKKINLFLPPKTRWMPRDEGARGIFGNQATGEVFSESARNVKPAYFGGKFANVNGIVNRELSSVALQGKILIKPGKTRWPESKELLR